jgi:hypothetical protein
LRVLKKKEKELLEKEEDPVEIEADTQSSS